MSACQKGRNTLPCFIWRSYPAIVPLVEDRWCMTNFMSGAQRSSFNYMANSYCTQIVRPPDIPSLKTSAHNVLKVESKHDKMLFMSTGKLDLPHLANEHASQILEMELESAKRDF